MTSQPGPSAVVDTLVHPSDAQPGELVLNRGVLAQLTGSRLLDDPDTPIAELRFDSGAVTWVGCDSYVAVRRYVTGPAALLASLVPEDLPLVLAALDDAAEAREDRAGQACVACGEQAGGMCAECAGILTTAGDYRALAGRLTVPCGVSR